MSCSIYSIISAVRNQPSPVWFPIDKISFTFSSKFQILQGNKYPFLELFRADITGFSKRSINLIAVLNNFAFIASVFINLLNVILCVAINFINPIKSGSITSAPSCSNLSATKLFPKGWYFIKTSPTIPTLGFITDVSISIFSKSDTMSKILCLNSLILDLFTNFLHFSIQ